MSVLQGLTTGGLGRESNATWSASLRSRVSGDGGDRRHAAVGLPNVSGGAEALGVGFGDSGNLPYFAGRLPSREIQAGSGPVRRSVLMAPPLPHAH